jgi:hypothetical protein
MNLKETNECGATARLHRELKLNNLLRNGDETMLFFSPVCADQFSIDSMHLTRELKRILNTRTTSKK